MMSDHSRHAELKIADLRYATSGKGRASAVLNHSSSPECEELVPLSSPQLAAGVERGAFRSYTVRGRFLVVSGMKRRGLP